jgi:hypothetical protein
MNNDIYNNNSTNTLQQKPDGSNTVCKHSWNSIYNNFHPIRRLPSVTVCMVLVSFLFFTGYVNTKKSGADARHMQSQTISDQHTSANTPLTTELSSDEKENNLRQQIFMQINILPNN